MNNTRHDVSEGTDLQDYGNDVVIADVIGTSYTDTTASTADNSFYWVYAYKKSGNTKRPGAISSYAYAKAK